MQVALDLTNIKDAISIARASAEEGAKIVEAGTPLIKKYGMAAVAEIKNSVGFNSYVLADVKAADVGELEVDLAADAGADAVTVLGCAPDSTIKAAANESKRRGVALFADMLGVQDPVKRAREVYEIGVEGIVLHVGIDVQKELGVTAEMLGNVASLMPEDLLVAAAGGLTAEGISRIKGKRINIFIVGGAITKSKNYRESIRRIIKVINDP